MRDPLVRRWGPWGQDEAAVRSRRAAVSVALAVTCAALLVAVVRPPSASATLTTEEAGLHAERMMVDLLNTERQQPGALGVANGHAPVAPAAQVHDLRDVSAAWSSAMADGACGGAPVCHNRDVGSQLCCARGYGENVGYTTFQGLDDDDVAAAARHLMQELLRSGPHAANMMDAAYDHVGVSVEVRATDADGGDPRLVMWTTHVFRDHDGTGSPEVVRYADASSDGDGSGTAGVLDLPVIRVAAADRYGTAADAATHAGGGVDVVYVASGDVFPDALTGGAAAAVEDAALVTTARGSLDPSAEAALRALDPDRIVVLGGRRVVGDAVVQRLRQLTTTLRIAGSDRYETAAEVARSTHPEGADTVVVASGASYADALSAANLSQAHGAPVLLTPPDGLAPVTGQVLEDLDPRRILVVGGRDAVSRTVELRLARHASVVRLGGQDRYETAAEVLRHAGLDGATAVVATGEDFADALAAGPLADRLSAPLLLVPGLAAELPASLRSAIDGLAATSLVVVGGPSVVGDAQVRAIWSGLSGRG